MRWSIRYQLLVPLLTLLLGVAGISTWTALASARYAWQRIESRVRNAARFCSEVRFFPLTEDVLKWIRDLSGAEYVLLPREGRRETTLPLTGEEWQTLLAQLPPTESVTEDWQNIQLNSRVTLQDQTYLYSSVRLHSQTGSGDTLYILYPEESWQEARWQAVRPSLVLGGFVGLASVVLALGVSQRFSRRIQALERRTRLIAAGDFSPMPLAGRNDELRDLGQSVNDMAQRLAQLQEAVQKNERLRLLGQVSGGLAHQLRNGVTGAILAVQLHARECTTGADHEALDVALRQLALLESNLKRFLDLGRTEGLRREPCALAVLLEEAVSLLRPQCRHARIDLRWQAPAEPVVVRGDSGQLGHLFVNVLGNAVEAAGPGGAVEVRLAEQGRVEILDSGPGPPSEIAARLFEPFVTSKQGGVGLGLAVARQVVQAHGGRIEWRRREGRTCFAIELPLQGG